MDVPLLEEGAVMRGIAAAAAEWQIKLQFQVRCQWSTKIQLLFPVSKDPAQMHIQSLIKIFSSVKITQF